MISPLDGPRCEAHRSPPSYMGFPSLSYPSSFGCRHPTAATFFLAVIDQLDRKQVAGYNSSVGQYDCGFDPKKGLARHAHGV